jgi:hypothetical protein
MKLKKNHMQISGCFTGTNIEEEQNGASISLNLPV